MDRLSSVLARFSLRAGVFHTGSLCGLHAFEHDARRGHLHLIRRGRVEMLGLAPEPLLIAEPTLIFLPRPEHHRLTTNGADEADVVCGTIQFGKAGRNPVTDSMPAVISVPLAALPAAEALLDLMFTEAFDDPRLGKVLTAIHDDPAAP